MQEAMLGGEGCHRRHSAREPAVTKALHRYDLTADVSLSDTPGLMWPKIEHESAGLMLAASHSIGIKAYDETEVALYLAEVLLERYPLALAARYGVAAADVDSVGVVEAVAAKRVYRLKGGALERVSLETPATFQTMVTEQSTPHSSAVA